MNINLGLSVGGVLGRRVGSWLIISAVVFASSQALADPVQLPDGWSASAPQYGMSTVSLAGSDDVVIVGLLGTADADKVVNLLANQKSEAYAIESVWPVTHDDHGVQGGATLRFPDGRVAGNFVFASVVTGQTALVSMITTDVQDATSLTAKMTQLGGVMKQLRNGATMPEPGGALPPAAPK